MDKKKALTIIGLLIYCIIIFIPLLIHGYVYPNIGDDTAEYVTRFEEMRNIGLQANVQYLGYIMVGYPIILISELFDLSMMPIFMWFNFLVLALVGVNIYFVISKLTNRLTGWIALLVTLFCSQSLMYLFYYGQIFNIINIGIILPILIYFTVRYAIERRLYQLVIMLFFTGLFSTFHTSGIYLPAIAGFVTVIYIINGWVRKQKVEKSFVVVGFGIVAISTIVFVTFILLPTMKVLEETAPDWEHINLLTNIGKGLAIPLTPYLLDIVSPSVLVLVSLLIVYSKETLGAIDKGTKIVIVLLLSIAITLAIAAFARVSLDPWRQAVDFATIFALIIALMVGMLIRNYKNNIVIIAIAILIGFGLFHNLPTWFEYNSAMSKADLEAIEYASKFEDFSCSSTIAPWVYMQYGDITHRDNGGEVVLMRNIPMTPRSTEDNIWYQTHGWKPDNSYELTKIFDDGRIYIEAYEVMEIYK